MTATQGKPRTLLVNWDPARWETALRKADPTLRMCVTPESENADEIDAILTYDVDAALVDRLPNLRLLHAVGAGVDRLASCARSRPHLRLARIVDDAMEGDVATLVVAGTLQWLRDLPSYIRHEADAQWQPLPVRSSIDTTIAILGMGRIGRTAARAFHALGFRVCGWSRNPATMEGVETYAGRDGLQALLPLADVLVCTLPLTQETAGIIGEPLLARLPRGAYVVNVGRGGHVDEAALLAAIERGHIAGAFLDVFAQEPLPLDHPFWRHPAVRVTPHVASRTQADRVAPQVVENLRRLRAGEPLLNEVDPSAGY